MIANTVSAEPASNAPKLEAHGPPLFDRIDFGSDADPIQGTVRWSPVKSLWWSGMTVGWLTLGTLHFSLSAVVVFVMLSGLTLCLGHSLGMHRKLIHRSFDCPKALERVLVYLGTLVGLGGPFTMTYTHDIRDWAQRSPACHDFLSHKRGILTDFWWQLHCKLYLDRGPDFAFPPELRTDAFYRALQATSMLQQVPPALLLYALGGWGWVAWGVCGRVSVSIFGHWLVGYLAHNGGERDWHVEGASTQGFNLRRLGLITFGECWHNNHHAFPGSAKLGLIEGQLDPGWSVLQGFERLGLVWNVQTPEILPPRDELRAIGQ
ncbi:MAG: acyl-CoA desaturase [Pseudomonadota bacterium]